MMAKPEAVDELAAVLDPPLDLTAPDEIEVFLTAVDEVIVARLPPVAWVRSETGGGCVLLRGGAGDEWSSVPFPGFDAELGVGVTADEDFVKNFADYEVLLNPQRVIGSSTC